MTQQSEKVRKAPADLTDDELQREWEGLYQTDCVCGLTEQQAARCRALDREMDRRWNPHDHTTTRKAETGGDMSVCKSDGSLKTFAESMADAINKTADDMYALGKADAAEDFAATIATQSAQIEGLRTLIIEALDNWGVDDGYAERTDWRNRVLSIIPEDK